MENDECMVEDEYCEKNKFKDNKYCNYGEITNEWIILISVISSGAVIGVVTLVIIRRKRKRFQ